MRKPSKKTLILKCDKLFADIIKSTGQCDRCGKTKPLNCAHIISRAYRNTRWNLENAVCLCVGCHFWAHQNPVGFTKWLQDYYGEDIHDRMKRVAQSIEPVDLDETFKYLTKLSKRT
jgi:5-methylcytosine-specific restriction endonuclease McrA